MEGKTNWKDLLARGRELIAYGIVGALTTLVSLGSYYLCVATVLDPERPAQLQAANVVSWICAVTFAYFTNRSFVFRSRRENRLAEAASFYLSRVGTLLADMGIMYLTVSLWGMNDKLAKFLVQGVVMVANYLVSKFFVFKGPARKNGPGRKEEGI